MRLITINTELGPRAAVERGQAAVIIPSVDGDEPYADVGAVLRAGPAAMDSAQRAARAGGEEFPFERDQLMRPVLQPGAVVCVGLNYQTHIREMGREMPSHPTLFSKLPRALTDPYADVTIPAVSSKFDFEGELVAVIGRGGRNIAKARAWEHVAGLTILNDVTGRDFQHRTIQWFAGKTFESCTPVGPAVVTLDEVGDIGALQLRVTVNGDERQSTRLDDMLFDVPTLIEDLSKIVTLEPGDLIATGSPAGVGFATETFLNDGDVVEVSIDGLGAIRNKFRKG